MCNLNLFDQRDLGQWSVLFSLKTSLLLQLVSELSVFLSDPSTASSKVDIEKFTSKNDFNIWNIKMETLSITQGLVNAIEPKTKKEGIEASSSKTLE